MTNDELHTALSGEITGVSMSFTATYVAILDPRALHTTLEDQLDRGP